MKGPFWVDGRLSWPMVIAFAYMSAALIVTDYAWRIIELPFETFLIRAMAISLGGMALLLILHFTLRRRSMRARRGRRGEDVSV